MGLRTDRKRKRVPEKSEGLWRSNCNQKERKSSSNDKSSLGGEGVRRIHKKAEDYRGEKRGLRKRSL